jgi:hypothetical protein
VPHLTKGDDGRCLEGGRKSGCGECPSERAEPHPVRIGRFPMHKGLGVAVLAVFVALGLAVAQEDKPKYTIKQVMKDAHKSNLWKKVAQGKATKEEDEKLVEYYTALTKNKPPKGDEKEWKEQTEAMLAAAKGAVKNDKAEEEKLLKLVNCMMCHGKFR